MEIVVYLIGISSVAVFVVPFVYSSRSRKKREKRLIQSLGLSSEKQTLKIGEHEFIGDFVIGFDEKSQYLLYCKTYKGQEIVHQIKLSEVQNCKVITKSRQGNTKDSHYAVMDKLDLNLSYIDKSKADTVLPFYDAEDDKLMNGETQIIEKWSVKVKNRLKHHPSK